MFKFTCVSVTVNSFAMSARSLELRYFFTSNCFSNSKIWRPVNVVRAFFLRRAASCDESSDESSAAISVECSDGGGLRTGWTVTLRPVLGGGVDPISEGKGCCWWKEDSEQVVSMERLRLVTERWEFS